MSKYLKALMVDLCLILLLTGCSMTLPVTAITSNGETLRGTTTASFSEGGHFSATNGKLTCSGNYNAWDTSRTISVQVLCNDGRKGIIIVTRQPDGKGGHGQGRLEDGTEFDLIFGAAAENF